MEFRGRVAGRDGELEEVVEDAADDASLLDFVRTRGGVRGGRLPVIGLVAVHVRIFTSGDGFARFWFVSQVYYAQRRSLRGDIIRKGGRDLAPVFVFPASAFKAIKRRSHYRLTGNILTLQPKE